jgi:hypothetical protein
MGGPVMGKKAGSDPRCQPSIGDCKHFVYCLGEVSGFAVGTAANDD